ncbi:hypothetical protein GOP47_0025808 [Adiantum capillus-veneris]|uniref:Carboxypeptidase n=1 Tax=Adiantum capillus-veneris TaxID=13818 RepID=A0A9D4U2S0_ADICA|nr:hypothetical protein GOP47_0025808 [Adiantum capillus-veneris]
MDIDFWGYLEASNEAQCINEDNTSHNYTKAQEDDRIIELPGQPANTLSLSQYAGHVTVNESAGRALFYWLVEAISEAANRPLVLWLNGGPGCSSMGYGAMEELGPFKIHPNGSGLYANPHPWNKEANMLFLESPAGVGYSYSNTSSDYMTAGDSRTAADSFMFLLKWMERFPQYNGREFYITGESYAGHYVPQLSLLIFEHNKNRRKPCINLKGFMVGNAVTDWSSDNQGIVDFYWSHSLISDQTYQGLLSSCPWKSQKLPTLCQEWFNVAYNEVGNIDLHTIYTPVCLISEPYRRMISAKHWNPLNSGETRFDPCTPNYADAYFNRVDVQKAFHTNITKTIQHPWSICNYDILDNWQDRVDSILPIYKELIGSGLRIWVYSGDQDAMVPTLGTRYWLKKLSLNITKSWYPWVMAKQALGR